MKVLNVSGSERNRAWVRMALGPGWQFDEAVDGLVAIAKATASPFDLVIADELTEPYGAFGLARELKILPEPPAVIVLLDRAQDNWLAKWSGADRWFVRPLDPFELSACAIELTGERNGRAPVTSSAE